MKISRFFAVSAIGVTMWSTFFAGECSGGTTRGSDPVVDLRKVIPF